MLLISANETELVDLWSAAMAITVFRVLSGNVLHEITENGGGTPCFFFFCYFLYLPFFLFFFFLMFVILCAKLTNSSRCKGTFS